MKNFKFAKIATTIAILFNHSPYSFITDTHVQVVLCMCNISHTLIIVTSFKSLELVENIPART